MFEKLTLVELRVEDAHVGGGMPIEGDDAMPRESMEMESDESSERRSMGSRVRRAAILGAVVGAVAAVATVARRVRGRRSEMDDEHEIELEGEDDVELTA
ncbi:hypothetical protein [Haloarchaeobius baliensis]|uniref:hypothetical protein n=1 Tax=Haloarchaeobius baliensis TaxID=1670458 RepID=UPI003F880948